MTILSLRQSLNKAFLKVKPSREEINRFKANLTQLLDRVNPSESEEFHKTLIRDFLQQTYYQEDYFINTKQRNDLVIHTGKNADYSVGVMVEVKRPNNKAEMISRENLNVKALQELLYYFLQERLNHNNLEIKHLIITNLYEWFIFDAQLFERLFVNEGNLKQQFQDFQDGRLTGKTTDYFYQEIAKTAITKVESELVFTYFDLRDYESYLRNNSYEEDHQLIPVFKIFAAENLLKLPFANDSNSLDKGFYSELLHIIGLTEVKEGNKKVIQRKKEKEREKGSLLENAISQIEEMDKLSRVNELSKYGETEKEQLFNIGLGLVITWINRILFLKLLEAQLINYHQGDKDFAFLQLEKIKNYQDLNQLFFRVLACQTMEREASLQEKFMNVPYLNSSLFEATELEQETLQINNLRGESLSIFSQTVLKDSLGKKKTGELNSLQYLFEFLDAYDFSSEGSEAIQEENKRLINASVLGLIFEKINGYQDGSFFTPGFITMYMCRETIRRAIIQKFNTVKGWNCLSFEDFKEDLQQAIKQAADRKIAREEANLIINDLKICDPAVGSGHFLVSALNEIIAVKQELGILQDKEGRMLSQYEIEVVNDELNITDNDGIFFEYHPQNKESQRVQETLFHEKQRIIENCLFGVDINPNSVKICQLRLWIELLKHAYYKSNNYLETLPNIDINIKVGNSLISRFKLDADLKIALSKSKSDIITYREAVQSYRNAENKREKRQMVELIEKIKSSLKTCLSGHTPLETKLRQLEGELYQLENQTLLFEETKTEKKKRETRINKLRNEIDKLSAEIEEMESGKLYQNAFEWRFEFPEVLDDKGNFIGFDLIIGNPPYIRQEEFKEIKPILQQAYQCFTGVADLFVYFYERGYQVLKSQGYLSYISSNKYFRSGYGEKLRGFLQKNSLIHTLIDFGDSPIFEEAIAYPSIIILNKCVFSQDQYTDSTVKVLTWNRHDPIKEFLSILKQASFTLKQSDLTANGWRLESSKVLRLLDKLTSAGIPLGEYVNGKFYYGIKTGFNEAFIIDRETRDRLIKEHPSSEEVLKPFLRGRDVKRWVINNPDLWLIFTKKGIDIHQYPAILNYLSQYQEKLEKRAGNCQWFELQASPANTERFELPKIVIPTITKHLETVPDLTGYYCNDKTSICISHQIHYLLGLLNSSLIFWFLKQIAPIRQGGFYEFKPMYVVQIPTVKPTEKQDSQITKIVNKILEMKQKNPQADVRELERKIDQIVYQLYGLTEEEIAMIEKSEKLS